MHSRLVEIIEEKKREVSLLKRYGLPAEISIDRFEMRDFRRALSGHGTTSIIAEIKFASPSAGSIRDKTDPVEIGRIYDSCGARAISFLTDKKFFNGDISCLPSLRKSVSIPVLRKDFIIDDLQVREAAIYGADALLLIARILSKSQLKELISAAYENSLAVLTEIHDEEDLEKALGCGADIIGINNRDLDTFHVDINTTYRLLPMIPETCVTVSESGINTKEDIKDLRKHNVNAALVGTSIMKSLNIKDKVRELVKAGIE